MDEYRDYDYDDDWVEGDDLCWHCCGEGWGIVGFDWDLDDEIEQCPCCGGSGLAKDCTFW